MIETQLSSKFSINKLGELCQLLGMEIHWTPDKIILTQTQYLTQILDCFGMLDCKPVHSPVNTHVKLTKLPDNESYPEIKSIYQNFIGSLIYASTVSCPNIAFTVHHLSQFNTNPGPAHLSAAK